MAYQTDPKCLYSFSLSLCVVFVVCIFIFLHSFQIHDFLSPLSWWVFVSFFFFFLFRSILFLSFSWWVCFCLYLSFLIFNFFGFLFLCLWSKIMFKYQQQVGVAMGLQPWVLVMGFDHEIERVHIINSQPWACGGEWLDWQKWPMVVVRGWDWKPWPKTNGGGFFFSCRFDDFFEFMGSICWRFWWRIEILCVFCMFIC